MPGTLSYEGDPLHDIETGRESYVSEVLLIVESWLAAGMPKASLTPIANYGGRWTDFCRQPLVWLGLDDPAEGLIEQLKTDPESASLGRLLTAWNNQLGTKPQTLRALVDNAEGDLLEAIEDLPFAEGGPLNRSRFGRYLGRNAGRPVDGLKLEKADSRERNAWRVIVVDGTSPSPNVAQSPPPSPSLPPSVDPSSGLRDEFD